MSLKIEEGYLKDLSDDSQETRKLIRNIISNFNLYIK